MKCGHSIANAGCIEMTAGEGVLLTVPLFPTFDPYDQRTFGVSNHGCELRGIRVLLVRLSELERIKRPVIPTATEQTSVSFELIGLLLPNFPPRSARRFEAFYPLPNFSNFPQIQA